MTGRRIPRLNEQLRREISEILSREVRDPRVGSATVTGVDVTPDLWVARVYVNLSGGEEERRISMAGLKAAASFIRGTLGKRLHVRRIPELRFIEDRTVERAMRIEQILDEVLPEPGSGHDAGDGEGRSVGRMGEDEANEELPE